MTEFKQYRRSAIAEIADWHEGFDMTRVSVSDADRDAGSPKPGDRIARNPENHDDRWLVAADYFADNFEAFPVPEAPSEREGPLGEAFDKGSRWHNLVVRAGIMHCSSEPDVSTFGGKLLEMMMEIDKAVPLPGLSARTEEEAK